MNVSPVRTAFFALCALCACSANVRSNNDRASTGISPTGTDVVPFEPFPPAAYVQRIKTILTSEVASADEVAQVVDKPASVDALIAKWQQTSGYQQKILAFLSGALQQSAVTYEEFDDQGVSISPGVLSLTSAPLLLENLRQMMARTVMALDSQAQPFSTTMNTTRFMMTPPLMAYYAYLNDVTVDDSGATQNKNSQSSVQSVMNQFSDADFAQWKMVTIRQPNQGEATTVATDVAALKTASVLVAKTPRIGFWSTPTFFAGWQTNGSNQARVTINQALIVALGHAFDGTSTEQATDLRALDTVHAAPATPCYGCHINLDPMRQFLRQAYTLHFSPQTNAEQTAMAGQFAFGGVNRAGNSIFDLGNLFASHPAMPLAWAQKVCTWANDMACVDSDPELLRVAQSFAGHGSFSTLVREVFSSPLVTWASPTQTTRTRGTSLSVAKLDHLCPLLATRLGLTDPCGLAAGAMPTGDMATVKTLATILPANGYSRGQVAPPQANDLTLFFRSGAENICALLSSQLVDPTATQAGGTTFDSSDPNAAISKMVMQLMGISQARSAEPIQLLQSHFTAAMAAKTEGSMTPTDALRSTFTVACLSPSVMGMGMGL